MSMLDKFGTNGASKENIVSASTGDISSASKRKRQVGTNGRELKVNVFNHALHQQQQNEHKVLKEEARLSRADNNLNLPRFDDFTCACGKRHFRLEDWITSARVLFNWK